MKSARPARSGASGRTVRLEDRAAAHWNPSRLQNLLGGRRLPLHPVHHCTLLHATGLMQDDASMKSREARKFLQISHMISLVSPAITRLARAMPGHTLHLLDAGCGNSWLSLALTYLAAQPAGGLSAPGQPDGAPSFRLHVTGVDSDAAVIDRSRRRAEELGLTDRMTFHCGPLHEAPVPDRLHAVLALHACDTATDDALVLGIRKQADVLAVAPCCQAELARQFRKPAAGSPASPLAVILNSPNLRRDAGALFTDALRIALVRALGYEATATEFVESSHTPKNRLILAERRGRYHLPSWADYRALRELLGNPSLRLESQLRDLIQERFPDSG